MKPTANFKLSRTAKRMLATIDDKQRRAEVRKLFIQSELIKEQQARMRTRTKETD